MRSEDLSVELRLRTPWEAVDLGFMMVRHWGGPVFLPWLLVVLPLAALLIFLLGPGLGCVVLWLLQPALDALPLFVLSRAVFGAPPRPQSTLRETAKRLPSLLWSNLRLRVDLARTLHLPLRLLEQLSGARRALRQSVLDMGCVVEASVLALACWLMEAALVVGLLASLELMTPRTMDIDWSLAVERLATGADGSWLGYALAAAYVLSFAFIEPFHVAGGFALYLNRRTLLEGWDLDIAFRRLAERTARQEEARERRVVGRPGGGIACFLLAGLLLVSPCVAPRVAVAANEEATRELPAEAPDPRAVAQRVLATPEFEHRSSAYRWEWRWDGPDQETEAPLTGLGEWLGVILVPLLWCLFALFLGLLAIFLLRSVPRWRRRSEKAQQAKPVLRVSGLDLRPESLPSDVPKEAESLWLRGCRTEALALLYRGALSSFVTRDALSLRESFTEEDCLHVILGRITESRQDYFKTLTRAWQSVAYAHVAPSDTQGLSLCADWGSHFGGRS